MQSNRPTIRAKRFAAQPSPPKETKPHETMSEPILSPSSKVTKPLRDKSKTVCPVPKFAPSHPDLSLSDEFDDINLGNEAANAPFFKVRDGSASESKVASDQPSWKKLKNRNKRDRTVKDSGVKTEIFGEIEELPLDISAETLSPGVSVSKSSAQSMTYAPKSLFLDSVTGTPFSSSEEMQIKSTATLSATQEVPDTTSSGISSPGQLHATTGSHDTAKDSSVKQALTQAVQRTTPNKLPTTPGSDVLGPMDTRMAAIAKDTKKIRTKPVKTAASTGVKDLIKKMGCLGSEQNTDSTRQLGSKPEMVDRLDDGRDLSFNCKAGKPTPIPTSHTEGASVQGSTKSTRNPQSGGTLQQDLPPRSKTSTSHQPAKSSKGKTPTTEPDNLDRAVAKKPVPSPKEPGVSPRKGLGETAKTAPSPKERPIQAEPEKMTDGKNGKDRSCTIS